MARPPEADSAFRNDVVFSERFHRIDDRLLCGTAAALLLYFGYCFVVARVRTLFKIIENVFVKAFVYIAFGGEYVKAARRFAELLGKRTVDSVYNDLFALKILQKRGD